MKPFLSSAFIGLITLFLSACVYTNFEYHSAQLEPQQDRMLRQIVITRNTQIELLNQQRPRLHANSQWQLVGTLPIGGVYRPVNATLVFVDDQVYDAFIIVSEQDDMLQGFYLPMKGAFITLDQPVSLPISRDHPASATNAS